MIAANGTPIETNLLGERIAFEVPLGTTGMTTEITGVIRAAFVSAIAQQYGDGGGVAVVRLVLVAQSDTEGKPIAPPGKLFEVSAEEARVVEVTF